MNDLEIVEVFERLFLKGAKLRTKLRDSHVLSTLCYNSARKGVTIYFNAWNKEKDELFFSVVANEVFERKKHHIRVTEKPKDREYTEVTITKVINETGEDITIKTYYFI